MTSSRVVWLRKNFTPGHYVLHCEMPVTTAATDTELTHADVGMVQEIEIKEGCVNSGIVRYIT